MQEQRVTMGEEIFASRDINKRIESLIKLDIDAVHIYGQAISHIEIETIRTQAIRFQNDHMRHVEDLSSALRNVGIEPPPFSRDFKGYFLEAFAAIRSLTGAEGAIKALKSSEDLTNRIYRDASTWEVPMEFKNIIDRNYGDEQSHLRYFEEVVETRAWESYESRR